jgi:murein biosynthesis integral membrane protein MurJ/undecaprenyldiphospho-muramoylpentapeptide beta-N-acetylglucosaminyltransferase
MNKHRFLFTGGGTGGHVYPNIAIYEALKEKYPDAEFLYVGSKKGSEAAIVPALPQPMEFVHVPARGLPQRIKSPKTVFALAAIFLGAVKSFFILRRFKPDIIIGSGGYAAAPVLLAAALLKKNVFIHEQNAVPGRLNLFVARFATRIGIAFPSTASFFEGAKVIQTGYPLRRSIRSGGEENSREKFNIPPNSRVLFICSGSMGARTINRAAAEIMPRLLALPDLFVIMSTGKAYGKDYKAYDDTVKLLEQKGYPPEIEGRLLVREYFDHIAEIYALSDLVVSRAGAGAIQEITAMGLPAILVPKIDLPADHQILNAREIEKIGGARVLYEEVGGGRKKGGIFLASDTFYNAIEEIIAAPDQLAAMRKNLLAVDRPDSTAIILNAVQGIIEKDRGQEREIRVFYLQAVEEEKNLELPFAHTSVGNTHFSDVILENIGPSVRFEIRFLNAKEQSVVIRRRKGRVQLNEREISGWTPLQPDDCVGVDGGTYIFKSYLEKTRGNCHDDMAGAGRNGSTSAALAARLLVFGREITAAAIFGAGKAMDIFSIARTVAGFFSRLLGSGAMEKAFMPIFSRLFRRGPRKKAWEAASPLATCTMLLSLLLTAAGMLLAPAIIGLLFPGLAAHGWDMDAARMTRILFPSLFLGTLAAILSGYLRVFHRSACVELAGLLFAAGAILGIFLFRTGSGSFSLAYGVLLGGLLQILFLLPFLLKTISRPALEFSYLPSLKINSTAGRKYATQLAPVGLGEVLTRSPALVDKFLASSLRAGSLSYLYFAMEIFRLPFALIAKTINRAVFRDFSESFALVDKEKTKKLFIDGIRINLFLLAPVSILMVTLANPIVSLLLERFNFSAQAVSGTALALQFYSIGLIGWGIHSLTTRIFAARLENRTSLFLDFFLLAFHVPLVILLSRTPLQFAGIALATSISYLTFALVRIVVLRRKLRLDGVTVAYGEIISAAGKTLSACLLMVIAIIEAKFVFNRIQFNSPTIENIIFCVSLTFMGTAIYFLSSLIFKNTGILIFKKRNGGSRPGVPVSLLSPFRFMDTVAANPEFYKAEYRYKINLYLSNPNWEIKNIGIKLVGLFKDKSKSAYLVDMLAAGQGNGFMRRNALVALRAVNPWSQEIKELLLRLLKDGYFEVRAAALDYLGHNISESEYAELHKIIQRRLDRGSNDEKIACLRLMARKGNLGDLPRLQRLYLDSNSLIREEVLELLYSFYRRNLLKPEEIKNQVQQVLVTSDHLTPEFRIKSIINRIYREIDHP